MESFVVKTIKIYMKIENMNYKCRSPTGAVFNSATVCLKVSIIKIKDCTHCLDLYN